MNRRPTVRSSGLGARVARIPAAERERWADRWGSPGRNDCEKALPRLALVAVLLLAAPLAAEAQQAGTRRIGLLETSFPSPARVQLWETLRRRLRELGYLEGQNIAFESRFGEGKPDRLPGLAAVLHDEGSPSRRSHCGVEFHAFFRGNTADGPRAEEPAAHHVRAERVRRGWRPYGVRGGLLGSVPASRDLRGQDPEGRQARRSPYRAADKVRLRDQPQDRENA